MVVLQVIKDRFSGVASDELSRQQMGLTTSDSHVRRPTRGIDLKEETFATLRVVAGNGQAVNLVDAGSKRLDEEGNPIQIGNKRATDVYSNFFLQSVSEDRMEKQQIIETFGEPYIFFFGERARVITFSGVLLNTFDFNWEAEWWHNYENFLRGTKCVENDARVFLSFDETIVSGYILATTASKSSQDRNFVQFQFQMFVTSYSSFSRLGSNVATQANHELIDQNDLASSSPFRPELVTRNLDLSGGIGPRGEVAPIDLFSAITEVGLTPIIKTWKRAQEIVGDSIVKFGDMLGAGLVRVPVGFAGTMVYDDEPEIDIKKIDSGKIKYGVFSDNHDEYVGSSDHYGSSVNKSGALSYVLSSEQDDIERNAELVSRAEAIWRDAGYVVPTFQLPSVAAQLINLGGGLLGVGATHAWRGAATALNGELGGATLLTEFGPLSSIVTDPVTGSGMAGRHGITDIES